MFSVKLLAEEASLEIASVLALASAFCVNVAVGVFAGSGGGGGVEIDVLGLAEVFSGVGRALLVLFTLVLDRDNNPFNR